MKKLARLNRPLGRTEHIYWLLNQLYCLNFLAFVELEGELDSDALASALDVVQQENPVLRARIALDKSGQPVFQAVASQNHPLVLQSLPLRNWRRQIEAQLITPFAAEDAPLARFLWFRGKGSKSVAAMVFHHSIADGKSGACVLLDVLRRATDPAAAIQLKKAHPASQQLDLLRDKGPVLGKLKELKFWLGKGKELLKFAEQLPGYAMEPAADRKIRVLPYTVSARRNAALLAACREQGTTIHGALGAALLIALNSEFEDREARALGLNSLADLRGVLKGGLTDQDLGLYITTLTTVHQLAEKPDFWYLARDIPEQLKGIMNSGDANLINGIYTENAIFTSDIKGAKRLQKIVALAAPSSMLTNIGRVGEADLGQGVRVRSLAFAVSPPAQHPLCVTTASYGGNMYLNVLYDQAKLQDAQVQRIAENLLAGLQHAASGAA